MVCNDKFKAELDVILEDTRISNKSLLLKITSLKKNKTALTLDRSTKKQD